MAARHRAGLSLSEAADPLAPHERIVELGFRPLDRREPALDLAQPGEVRLAFLVGERTFGRPKLPM